MQAEPQNQVAKDLLADVFEQLGYQQENPGLRNSYLAAAYELRSGIPQGETVDSSSPDVIRAMSTELFLNFLGILNLILHFDDLLPTHAPIGPLFFAAVWAIVIMPIVQFGQVLYPSRTGAEKEFN